MVNNSNNFSANILRIKANSKGKAKEINIFSIKNNKAINSQYSQYRAKDTKIE
jgi:hypothetical protein